MTTTQAHESYCLKCKEKRVLNDPYLQVNAKGSPVLRGTCSDCGTRCYCILSTERAENLKKTLEFRS